MCVYCGNAAGTRDHVPPKVLLDEPYPPDLPPVPACDECNNRFSTMVEQTEGLTVQMVLSEYLACGVSWC